MRVHDDGDNYGTIFLSHSLFLRVCGLCGFVSARPVRRFPTPVGCFLGCSWLSHEHPKLCPVSLNAYT